MKVLALDFGSARTGVAVSDPTGTLARPVTIVEQAATVFDEYGADAWYERPIEEFVPPGLSCRSCGGTLEVIDVDEADGSLRGVDGDLPGAGFWIGQVGLGEDLGSTEGADDHGVHELVLLMDTRGEACCDRQ